MTIFFDIPFRLPSEANISDHWTKKHKRKQQQKAVIHGFCYWKLKNAKLPLTIELTRCGPKQLDYDNLVIAFKTIRDTLADIIIPGLRPGRADDNPDLHFKYAQEVSKKYAIRITVESH